MKQLQKEAKKELRELFCCKLLKIDPFFYRAYAREGFLFLSPLTLITPFIFIAFFIFALLLASPLVAQEGIFRLFESAHSKSQEVPQVESLNSQNSLDSLNSLNSLDSLRIDPNSLMQHSLYFLQLASSELDLSSSSLSVAQSKEWIARCPQLHARAIELEKLLYRQKEQESNHTVEPLFAAFLLSDQELCNMLWPGMSENVVLSIADEKEISIDARCELWSNFAHYLDSFCSHLKPEDPLLSKAIFTADSKGSPQERLQALKEKILFDFYTLSALCYMPESRRAASGESLSKEDALKTIEALNRVLFQEQKIRFPHLNRFERDLASHSDMKSVLDKREGVCLGVSILYYALAQRFNLSLELVTPPGHIYPRYVEEGTGFTRNIETTAYGAHFPSTQYEGHLRTPFFGHFGQLPTVKSDQIAQMLWVNKAAGHLSSYEYASAFDCYTKAIESVALDFFDPSGLPKVQDHLLHLQLYAALLCLEQEPKEDLLKWSSVIDQILKKIKIGRQNAGALFTSSGAVYAQTPFYIVEDLQSKQISKADAGTILKIYYDPTLSKSRQGALSCLKSLQKISFPKSLFPYFDFTTRNSRNSSKEQIRNTPISARYAQIILCQRLSSIRGDYYHEYIKELIESISEEFDRAQPTLWQNFPREALMLCDLAHHLQEKEIEEGILERLSSLQVPAPWFPAWIEPSEKKLAADLPFLYLRSQRFASTYLMPVNKSQQN